jgi:hypothetical protein
LIIDAVEFIFTRRLPSDVASLRSKSITIVHDSLWLVIDDFSIIVALPCAIVFLERCTPTRISHINKAVKQIYGDFFYLLHGNTQIPQHFSIPLKFFSASRMSALI